VGQLKRNPHPKSTNAVNCEQPYWVGVLSCWADGQQQEKSITLSVLAWIKETPPPASQKFFSLDCGGIEGSLFRILPEDKLNPAGPDYTGNFAYAKDNDKDKKKMRLAAWIKSGPDPKTPYLSLSLEEAGQKHVDADYRMAETEDPTLQTVAASPAPEKQQSETTSSIPGFD
jgi:hypothetical protein